MLDGWREERSNMKGGGEEGRQEGRKEETIHKTKKMQDVCA